MRVGGGGVVNLALQEKQQAQVTWHSGHRQQQTDNKGAVLAPRCMSLKS